MGERVIKWQMYWQSGMSIGRIIGRWWYRGVRPVGSVTGSFADSGELRKNLLLLAAQALDADRGVGIATAGDAGGSNCAGGTALHSVPGCGAGVDMDAVAAILRSIQAL